MEDADEVLAARTVDAGLAADGRVDLRQQRSRDLHEVHAAAHDAGGKSGQIANNTATERDDDIAAFQSCGEHAVHHLFEMRETLGLFSSRQRDDGGPNAALFKAGPQRLEVGGGDIDVGDHRGARAGQAARNLGAGAQQQAGADQYVIGAIAEPDFDGDCRIAFHERASPVAAATPKYPQSAFTTSAAMTSLRSSRVGTVTSAVA
jgi:hypothetical protein